ncbi:hypothetical protein MMC20_004256 [Loxospora ochrophaea]|nr:hypothetical protein [Loxospora ochrophaea]
MSLARAFTTRRAKHAETSSSIPTRALSTRGPINRTQISAPLGLLSTTNVLAFNAPDIHSASSSSANSVDDSDSWINFNTSSRETTPDTSSIEASPIEPNHLSTYFRSAGRASTQSNTSSDNDAPAIPSRALSHTSKSHQAIARKRSMSKKTPPPSTIHNTIGTHTSVDMFSAKPDADHPFGAELAQVNELAEEFAKDTIVLDEEEQFLMSQGLKKFGAEDYVMEIQGLFGGVFEDRLLPMGAGWI